MLHCSLNQFTASRPCQLCLTNDEANAAEISSTHKMSGSLLRVSTARGLEGCEYIVDLLELLIAELELSRLSVVADAIGLGRARNGDGLRVSCRPYRNTELYSPHR